MHDIRFIRENAVAFDQALKNRALPPLSAALLALDEKRRAAIAAHEAALARRNAASKEIGQAMAQKDTARADALKAEVAALKDAIAAKQAEADATGGDLQKQLEIIPNMPLADVPVGPDETANVEVRRHLAPPTFAFAPKQHFELGEALGLMDFEAAVKISGARFVVLKGALARLERALGQFMLDLHTGEHGYQEVNPPILVRDHAMFGTAQLPKFTEDQFMAADMLWRGNRLGEILAPLDGACAADPTVPPSRVLAGLIDKAPTSEQFWLIPTAEVPLTNLVREQIVDEALLPMRVTALTPCFRAEAGSAGRDTRGMLRQHQFMKVEMVSITTPEASLAEHERMTACAETVLKKLGIPFRTIVLCTGDMGFASQKTYDIEAWLPGQGTFREISSCSVCGDFQARRMNARCKTKDSKGTRFVHTLNGSGIAVGRALIAVMENYQTADGSITVPDALRPYMGGIERITKAN